MCEVAQALEEKGIEKGRAEVIESLLRKGYTPQQISQMLDIQPQKIQEIEEKLCALQ